MERRLYFIPGVATDCRVFAELQLPDYKRIYLDWIPPLSRETIEDYACRMAARIQDEAPILIGYSFGGIMAIEMAKHLPAATVILISSIKSYRERPLGMWLTASLSLHRLVPTEIGKEFRFAYTWMNDPQTPTERTFIQEMKDALDPIHTDWAIHQAVSWRHDDHTPRLFHIHGDQDRIFPIRYVRNCIPVRGGTHLMLLNKGQEIGAHIHRIVQAVTLKYAEWRPENAARNTFTTVES
jgi:pimeloyl-ACP methyl ester carboxylesterase